jgi:hypothetical protein
VPHMVSTERGRELAEKYARPRGDYLGRIEAWGLDVFEGSLSEWIDALMSENGGCGGAE